MLVRKENRRKFNEVLVICVMISIFIFVLIFGDIK